MKLRAPGALGLFQLIATIQYFSIAVLLLGIPVWFYSIHIKRKKARKLSEQTGIPVSAPSTLRKYTQRAVTILAWVIWALLLSIVIWFRFQKYSRPIF